MKVKVYSTKTCHYCEDVKEYLKNKNINFECVDVSSDLEARAEMMKLSGRMGVPQVKIGDEVVLGFDKEAIDGLLESYL